MPYRNPNNYVKLSGRLAEKLAQSEPNGAIWANQFDNVANRDGHVGTTAEEIWRQSDGKVDGFVCAVGTGGTLAGVSAGLKAKSNAVKIAIADPMGAALHSYYTTGELRSERIIDHRRHRAGADHGQSGRVHAGLLVPDPDDEALPIVFDLIQEEGLCLGGSSGINVAGAVRLARELGPGHTIVTILCDYGTRYSPRCSTPDFLRGKDLPVPAWMEGTPDIAIPFEDVAP